MRPCSCLVAPLPPMNSIPMVFEYETVYMFMESGNETAHMFMESGNETVHVYGVWE